MNSPVFPKISLSLGPHRISSNDTDLNDAFCVARRKNVGKANFRIGGIFPQRDDLFQHPPELWSGTLGCTVLEVED
jgi:hypothetical protein